MRSAALLLMCVACGAPDSGAELQTHVSFRGISATAVGSVDVFVVRSKTSTGSPLSCFSLGSGSILAQEDAIVTFTRIVTPGHSRLSGVPADTNLLVVLEGYASADGSGQRVARACKDGVNITNGKVTPLDLTLTPP